MVAQRSDTQPGCFSPRCNRNLGALAGMHRLKARDHYLSHILSEEFLSAAAPRRVTKAQRAWRIEQSCRVFAYSFLPHALRLTAGCACFVPEPGAEYTLRIADYAEHRAFNVRSASAASDTSPVPLQSSA